MTPIDALTDAARAFAAPDAKSNAQWNLAMAAFNFATAHEAELRDLSPPPNQGCDVPPPGWYCSREPGHDGPCAARPALSPKVEAKGEWVTEEDAQACYYRGSAVSARWEDLPESYKAVFRRIPRSALTPKVEAQGEWVMVPREPTEAMRKAAFDTLELNYPFGGFNNGTEARDEVYRAMISASPSPPVDEVERGLAIAKTALKTIRDGEELRHCAGGMAWTTLEAVSDPEGIARAALSAMGSA